MFIHLFKIKDQEVWFRVPDVNVGNIFFKGKYFRTYRGGGERENFFIVTILHILFLVLVKGAPEQLLATEPARVSACH